MGPGESSLITQALKKQNFLWPMRERCQRGGRHREIASLGRIWPIIAFLDVGAHEQGPEKGLYKVRVVPAPSQQGNRDLSLLTARN